MAVNLLRRKKPEEPPPPPPERKWQPHWPTMRWPRRRAEAAPPEAPAPPTRRPIWPQRDRQARQRKRAPWRRRPYNPISVALWAAAWAALLILGLGMLLVSADANGANWFVHATMKTGTWLATPFSDVFHNPNWKHQLYENWSLAAAVYFVAGRTLSWLLQWPR